MSVRTATHAMRRKAGAGRPAPEVSRMTPARAWTVAMPRAAQDALAVEAAILQVDESRAVSAGLPDLVAENALITLIEGPADRFGVAILDLPVLSGLVEAATTGRVSARAPIPRQPTRTDAIIAADFLDALLEAFEGNLAEMDEPPNLVGYRYAAPAPDARAMTMTLAEGAYSLFRLTVSLGGGAREGEIVVAFPVAPRGAASGVDVAAFQRSLADNVLAAPSELEATLFRLHKPLAEITRLGVGDIVKVPLAALAAVRLEASGGKLVARARLGQQGGNRAIRIAQLAGQEPADPPEDAEFREAAPAPAALPQGEPATGAALRAEVPPADAAGAPLAEDGGDGPFAVAPLR